MRDKFIRTQFAFAAAVMIAVMLSTASPLAQSRRAGSENRTLASITGLQRLGTPRELAVKEVRSGGALDGRGKLWAVVIGVSSYKNLGPNDQLQFAHRDAEDFAAFLRSPNGGGFPSNQLTLLTNETATLSAVRSALGTTLPRSVEPDDMVIIFFAGHGVVEGEGEGYLLAYDSEPQNLYATALQVSELNRIVSERLKARTIILITDACHSGSLGWAARGTRESTALINRYLDEVGKSGKGVFRLLASRADQLSYEDKRFGGGHGCFTWFMLEGLRGKADRDSDGFVRIGELIDYLSEAVPNATQSLQQPRAAGDIDTRLPLSVLPTRSPAENVAAPAPAATLEVRGAPGLEVYLDNAFRGHVLPSGVLKIEQLKPGDYEVAILSRSIDPIAQKISLSAGKTILDVKVGNNNSPLAAQIKQALKNGNARGAFALYQQMVKQAPGDPQRAAIEMSLSSAFEAIGQKTINAYVKSSGADIKRDMFQEAADAYSILKTLQPKVDREIEAKYLFCQGRALIEEQRYADALVPLKQATVFDPKAAYTHHALGLAYRGLNDNEKAVESLQRAVELAPAWALPQIQLGAIYLERGRSSKAAEAFSEAAQRDPSNYLPHEQLAHLYLKSGKLKDAGSEAELAVNLGSKTGVSHMVLGMIYERRNLWRLAADNYEKGLALISGLSEEDRKGFTERLKKCRKKAAK
ncbi:MAG: tetratricopeptide repeat protein [Blastocatellia bacterium]|nr:tetratricopeptide repeat protein [Blastocatellia bacterium]